MLNAGQPRQLKFEFVELTPRQRLLLGRSCKLVFAEQTKVARFEVLSQALVDLSEVWIR